MIELGTSVPVPFVSAEPVLTAQHPAARSELKYPWVRAAIAQMAGFTWPATQSTVQNLVCLALQEFSRPALIGGASGGGKTFLAAYLLLMLLKAGCSVVAVSPKSDLLHWLIAAARQVGLSPEQVIIFDAGLSGGASGMNPFAAGLGTVETAREVVDAFSRSSSSWGARLGDLLMALCIVVSALSRVGPALSLFEAARLLSNEDYLDGLLARPCHPDDEVAFFEAVTLLKTEYASMGRAEKAAARNAVMNKFRAILLDPFLQGVFCARSNALNLARLWQRQSLVIVRLHPAMGDDGMRLLSGFLTRALYTVGLRYPGERPVNYLLDELPVVEKFIGSGLSDIAAVGRGLNLRLMACFQAFAQVSPALRECLLGNCNVQAFYRLPYEDARLIGTSLAAGWEPRLESATVQIDRKSPPQVWRHPVLDASGRPLRLHSPLLRALRRRQLFGADAVAELMAVARASPSDRLYVKSAHTGKPVEVARYTAKTAPETYWLEQTGGALQLAISFPSVKLTGSSFISEADAARRWTKTIQELAVGQCVLKVGGRPQGVVQVRHLASPEESPEHQAYLRDALAANGQTGDRVRATIAWRRAQVEAVAGGSVSEETCDGSF